MKKFVLTFLVMVLGVVLASAQAPTFGVFEEVVETTAKFADVTAALEQAIGASSLKLLASWDLLVPEEGKDYKSKVFVLHDPTYTQEIGKFDGPHAPAAILRINVYMMPGGKVRVNIVNPETMVRVYCYQHGVDDASFKKLIGLAADVKKKLEDLITANVKGTVLKQQSGPIREEKELMPYVGDGDAKVMVNFSDYKAIYEQGLVKTFDKFEDVVKYTEEQLKNNKEGWKLIATLDVGRARYFGISKPSVEQVSAKIVGVALGASKDNPVPGINHNGAYPIEVLVYPDGGKFKLAFPTQMWRMMLYYWDAGIGAFVQYQTLPGEFDASILKALGGK